MKFPFKRTINFYIFYSLAMLPIIIFFFDVFNIQTSVYAVNFMKLGLNPEGIGGASTGAGYYIYLYDFFQLFLYGIAHYNILFTAMLLKVFSLISLFVTGLISRKLLTNKNEKISRLAFYAILFNPFILFIIMVGPYTSVLIFFMLVLGLYEIKGNAKHKFIGWLFIIMASAWYIFPAFLIPSFLAYNWKTNKNLKDTIIPFLLALIMFIPSFILFKANISNVVSSYSASSGLAPYSFLILLNLSISQIVSYNGLIIYILTITALILPILFRRIGVNEFLCYATIIIVYLALQTANVSPDYFTSAIPFLIVGFLMTNKKPSYLKIIALQLFLLPQFFLLVLRNGNSYYTGFYYWGYYLFHTLTPSSYFDDLGGNLSWHVSLLFFIILALVTLFYLIEHGRNTDMFSTHKESLEPLYPANENKKLHMIQVILLSLVLLIFIAPSLSSPPINYAGTNAINNSVFMTGVYPTYSWVPPNIGYNISNNLSSIGIKGTENNIGIYRNITGQNFDLTASIIEGSIGQSYNYSSISLMRTNLFSLGYSTALNLSDGHKLVPNEVINASDIAFLPSTILNGANHSYHLSGNGFLSYNISYSEMKMKTFVFASEIGLNNSRINVLFSMYSNNTNVLVGLHRFSDGAYQIIYQWDRGTIYRYNFTLSTFQNKEWIPVILRENSPGNLTVYIGNYNHTFKDALTGKGNLIVYLGMAGSDVPIDKNQFSLNGNITPLYSFTEFPRLRFSTFLEFGSNLYVSQRQLNNSQISISKYHTTIGYPFNNITINGTSSFIWIGKLGSGNVSITINFISLDITNPNFDIINIYYLSLILPVISVVLTTEYVSLSYFIRRKGRS